MGIAVGSWSDVGGETGYLFRREARERFSPVDRLGLK